MERSELLKKHLPLAFGPEDLTRMQTAFDRLCEDEAAHLVNEIERENLAKAIVTAYDSKMDERTLRAVALSVYANSGGSWKPRAWA